MEIERSDINTASDTAGNPVQALVRIAVVVVAAAIYFIRMPGVFTNPQFWGEDGGLFFAQSLTDGWVSVLYPGAGYLTLITRAISNLARYFGAAPAPAIYNYSAVAIALASVWVLTSPRLDLPYKPIAALAVVVTPMGFEVLGGLANTQWILPVVVAAIILMRPHDKSTILYVEAIFVFFVSLTGPFSVFLAPLTFALAFFSDDYARRRRLKLFGAVLSLGAVIQISSMITVEGGVFYPWSLSAMPYPWYLWITLPVERPLQIFGGSVTNWFLPNWKGAAAALVVGATFVALTVLSPRRISLAFLLALGFAITLSGMLKYRELLPLLMAPGNQRYFYAQSVFVVFIVLALPQTKFWRSAIAATVILTEIASIKTWAKTEKITEDLHWAIYATAIDHGGIPDPIPINPNSWTVDLKKRTDCCFVFEKQLRKLLSGNSSK
jgi:hypothetical protein